jgi:hypothetical protein
MTEQAKVRQELLANLNHSGKKGWERWAQNIQPRLRTMTQDAGVGDVEEILLASWKSFPGIVRDTGKLPLLDVSSLMVDIVSVHISAADMPTVTEEDRLRKGEVLHESLQDVVTRHTPNKVTRMTQSSVEQGFHLDVPNQATIYERAGTKPRRAENTANNSAELKSYAERKARKERNDAKAAELAAERASQTKNSAS